MILYKNIKGKRIQDVKGFVRGYAYDPDLPWFDNHVFLMFNILPENGILDKEFQTQYGDLFVRKYTKNIDFKAYNIYVFKRDPEIVNTILAIGSIEHKLPLEDDDSLYFPDDYSLTVEKLKRHYINLQCLLLYLPILVLL